MSSASGRGRATPGFGLARTVLATSHFEPGQEGWLGELAGAFPHCVVFGLPNDSALAVSTGQTPAGRTWQCIEIVVDNSWDRPGDAWHIKTRQGVLVQHVLPDGRGWRFGGGDRVARLLGPDGTATEALVFPAGGPAHEHRTGRPVGFGSVEEWIAAR
jgi:hypothetical protein